MAYKCSACGRPARPGVLLCDCGHSLIGDPYTPIAAQQPAASPAAKASDSFLRSIWSWLPLPFAAWILSIPFLGVGAFLIPIVIANAPLGIIGYFEKIGLQPTPSQQVAVAALHAGFWLLFICGMALRRVLPLTCLWPIWLALVTALFMSVSGCAIQFGSFSLK